MDLKGPVTEDALQPGRTDEAPSSSPAGPPLRVLYLIDGLDPGGAEHSLAEMLPHYLAAGVRTVIVCLRQRDTAVAERIQELGCEIRILPGGSFVKQVRALRRMIRREKPDLVHTTLYASDIAGRVAAAATGVPVLTSLVNTTYEPARLLDPNVSRAALWLNRVIDGWTARRLTAHFHAISDAVEKSAVRALGIAPEKVSVIVRGRSGERLGAPSAARRREARRLLGIDDDAEVVLNVARQWYQKGQKHLLEAFGALAPERPELVLLIAGRDGHASAELRRMQERLGLGDRIRFLGNRDDVPELLAAADVFAFPSLYEGLGGALIEAMALGVPIVATDLPAVREVVEEGGNALLVPPGSPTDLARALRRLLEQPELRASFAATSVRRFKERFTIERSVAQMVALYRRVALAGPRALPERGKRGPDRTGADGEGRARGGGSLLTRVSEPEVERLR